MNGVDDDAGFEINVFLRRPCYHRRQVPQGGLVSILIKRAYAPPEKSDGLRILIDRLWPRGIAKSRIDLWLKDVSPSTELRQWFGHDPDKWSEFRKRYRSELRGNSALDELRTLSRKSDITLIYAARDERHNHAVVLKQILESGT